MAVQYRVIQSDFSGGEIDPLAKLNLNSGLRSIGVRESLNMIHMASGAAAKRSSSEIAYRLKKTYDGKIAAALSMQLSEKNLEFIFYEDESSTYLIYDGESDPIAKNVIYNSEKYIHKGSHFAVYQNYIVEVNEAMKPMLYEVKVDTENNTVSVAITRPDNWSYKTYPSSCAFAQGRLFLSVGNTLIASRTMDEDGGQRFFDFTLADYEYEESVYSYVHYTEGAIDEKVYAWLYFKGDYVSTSTVSLSDWNTLKALTQCYKEVYTYDKTYETAQEEEILEVDDSGNKIKRTYNRKIYTVTRNLTGGIADTENIICKTYVLTQGGVADSKVVTESVTEFPDGTTFKNDGTDRFLNNGKGIKTFSKSPYVYSDHAIEITESDMYGSKIQWIANLGRIVVATNNSIFISTADSIAPSTFDLTPTAYIGSSSIQPKIVSNMLLWVSLDRKKIYGAVYSNESQGLQTSELTSNAYHMFQDKIRQLEVADTPQLTVYAVTENGDLRVCTIIQTTNGTMCPWSTWTFPVALDYVYVFRNSEGNYLYVQEGKDGARVKDLEVYQYGEDTVGLLMDHIEVIEAGTESETVAVPGYAVYQGADEIAVIYHDNTDSTIVDYVTRREKVTADGRIKVRRSSKQAGHDMRITIGITYTSKLGLFTPVLPTNSGTALMNYHAVSRLDISLYRSLGGEVIAEDKGDHLYVKQLNYGNDSYSDTFLDKDGIPLAYTGVYGVDNPTMTTREDNISVISRDPYPFTVMAIAQLVKITEVN